MWIELLQKLNAATVGFLNTLIDDGADVYQLFDSWAGLLTPAEYGTWVQPFHVSILGSATGVPRILFVKEGPYLDRMCATGADVMSLLVELWRDGRTVILVTHDSSVAAYAQRTLHMKDGAILDGAIFDGAIMEGGEGDGAG